MSQLSVSRGYASGDPLLFASELTAPVTDIEQQANTTKYGNDNLQDDSIGNNHIAPGSISNALLSDSSVTAAKIIDASISTNHISDSTVTNAHIIDGSITKVKRAGDTYTVSGSTGLVNITTSGSPQQLVTTGAMALTGGYPVLLSLSSEGGGVGASIVEMNNPYAGIGFGFYRSDGTKIAGYEVGHLDGRAGLTEELFGSMVAMDDNPPAGVYSYYVAYYQPSFYGAVTSVTVKYLTLTAIELWK